MNTYNAYERRETLTQTQLENLEAALLDEIRRYQRTLDNYPLDRLEKYGKPYMAVLLGRLEDVQLLRRR